MLNALARYFFRGLIVVVPVALTGYVVWAVFVGIDDWVNIERLLDRKIPGAGVAVTFALITAIGFLASNFATRGLVYVVDGVFRRLPLVKLLYTSSRDVLGAFVGDEKRFDRPVRVHLGDPEGASVLGFLTREDLQDCGLPGLAAVYVPQSYNFAGNLIVVPRDRISPIEADSVSVMAFVVSAGVAGHLHAPPPTEARRERRSAPA